MDQESRNDEPSQVLEQILYSPNNTKTEHETRVYGVFDGAAIDDLWIKLDRWGIPHASLFDDGEIDITKTVSPYVVELTKNHEASLALLKEYGNNTGIYLQSPMLLAELQSHLKGFFRIMTINNQPALFRFYSPSVFREYVVKSDDDYLGQFFLNIDSCFVEDLDKESLIQYRWCNQTLQSHTHVIVKQDYQTTDDIKQRSGTA